MISFDSIRVIILSIENSCTCVLSALPVLEALVVKTAVAEAEASMQELEWDINIEVISGLTVLERQIGK
jgi:hypothetical protein